MIGKTDRKLALWKFMHTPPLPPRKKKKELAPLKSLNHFHKKKKALWKSQYLSLGGRGSFAYLRYCYGDTMWSIKLNIWPRTLVYKAGHRHIWCRGVEIYQISMDWKWNCVCCSLIVENLTALLKNLAPQGWDQIFRRLLNDWEVLVWLNYRVKLEVRHKY